MIKRKLLIALTACALGISSLPALNAQAGMVNIYEKQDYDEGEDDDEEDDMDDEDELVSGELTKDDIRVTPAKKTIQKGKTFRISIAATVESDYADMPDEEWDEVCENNIDSIVFRSSKSSVASVNKETGKVTGRKKGSATIKTTVNLANGDTITLKTKVYVTN